jgi:ribosomal protein S18 acetylase RimI-like enzyme
MLGLLLISETHQKKGFGKLAYKAIEEIACAWAGVRKIRIGVVMTNKVVLPFWESIGFRETGERRPYREHGIASETVVLKNPCSSEKPHKH